MIGRFTCTYRGQVVTATLEDDLEWSADHPLLRHALSACCRPDPEEGPSGGQPGHAAFHAAVALFRGHVVAPPSSPPDRGQVF